MTKYLIKRTCDLGNDSTMVVIYGRKQSKISDQFITMDWIKSHCISKETAIKNLESLKSQSSWGNWEIFPAYYTL